MKSQSVTAPSLTKKRYTFFTDILRNRFSYLLILPALLYVLVFSYLSSIHGEKPAYREKASSNSNSLVFCRLR